MTQVSKRFLQKQVEDRILDLFWTSLTTLSTKQQFSLFLDEFLTPTEKIMLSKRLAIAFMLMKGYDYTSINERLKVSDQTIWNIKTALHFRGNNYKRVITEIMRREKWEKLWDDLDHFLEQIVPPRPGTNWKEVRRRQWEKRNKQKKPF